MAVDVIRAATTATTAVALGHRCFPVRSIELAVPLAAELHNPLLAGELGGTKPYGFHLQNSPAELARRNDRDRPVILLSTSGTRLMCEAALRGDTFIGSLRTHSALSRYLLERGRDVTLLGAASRGDFREEDQLCCARLAAPLVREGYEVSSGLTAGVLERWATAPASAVADGCSAQYLRDTGQQHDLDFILDHIDDLDAVHVVHGDEVVAAPA